MTSHQVKIVYISDKHAQTVFLELANLAKYMRLVDQPYLLMDIHVRGHHLQKLSEALCSILLESGLKP